MRFPADFVLGASDAAPAWEDPVSIARDLGLQAYRFAIPWAQVQPRGHGPLDPAAVARCHALLDELVAAGIAPLVTLGGELPRPLRDSGGWSARSTADAFAAHARAVARELGDRVWLWVTLDDPWRTAFLPAGRVPAADALAAAHHLNLAHGLATLAIREELPRARVSIALTLQVTRPEDEEDSGHIEAVRTIDLAGNHVFLGPLLDGSYPTDLVSATRHLTDWSFVREGDLLTARQRLDVLGVNHFSTAVVRPAATQPTTPSPWVGADHVEFLPPVGPLTATGRTIDPEGLYDLLTALDNVYPDLPLLVTANGAAVAEEVDDDAVRDPQRRDFLAAHLAVVERAIEAGVDVRGFLVWTLLDAAEPDHPRFGLVHADTRTLVKDSGRWYSGVIAEHVAAHRVVATEEPQERPPGLLARLLRRGS